MTNSLHIALVGNPGAGKTTLQNILSEMWGVRPVDDGRILRDIAKRLFGLTEEQVTTQEGKASVIEIDGKPWEVRKILGEIGNRFEEMFGEKVLAYAAMNSVKDQDGLFSYGSVRKSQPQAYRERDGIVVEVVNPNAGESGNTFDNYDKSSVTHTIFNDGYSLEALRQAALQTLSQALGTPIVTATQE